MFFLFGREVYSKSTKTLEQDKFPLGLINLLDIALQRNNDIKVSYLNVDIADNDVTIQKSNFYPTITATGGYSYQKETEVDSTKVSLEANYTVFAFGKNKNYLDQVKYRLSKINYEKDLTIKNLLYNVSVTYYETLMLLAQKRSLIESEKSSSETLKAASLKHKLGIAVLADKLSAKAGNSRDKLKLIQINNSIKNSKSKLNILLNLDSNYNLFIEELEIRIGKTKTTFKKLLDMAFENRSEIKIKNEEKKILEKEIEGLYKDKLPTVTAGMGVAKQMDNTKDTSTNFNIGVSIPIFSGFKNVNQIKKAKNNLKIINVEIEELKNNISMEVWTAFNDLVTSENGFHIANETLESESARSKLMLGMYKNGKASILEVLDANDAFQNAKYELINTKYNWFINRITLLKAMGKLTIENINNIEGF
jgi:outer membrane protein TolC